MENVNISLRIGPRSMMSLSSQVIGVPIQKTSPSSSSHTGEAQSPHSCVKRRGRERHPAGNQGLASKLLSSEERKCVNSVNVNKIWKELECWSRWAPLACRPEALVASFWLQAHHDFESHLPAMSQDFGTSRCKSSLKVCWKPSLYKRIWSHLGEGWLSLDQTQKHPEFWRGWHTIWLRKEKKKISPLRAKLKKESERSICLGFYREQPQNVSPKGSFSNSAQKSEFGPWFSSHLPFCCFVSRKDQTKIHNGFHCNFPNFVGESLFIPKQITLFLWSKLSSG